MTFPAWLNNPTLWLCLLAGLVGAVWALSEIIGEFRTETARALRTWGAWLNGRCSVSLCLATQIQQ
jgi:hypothetical protein